MSGASCCGFCRRLPPLARNRAGKPSKCPVCKQEIWIGASATYRLVEADKSWGPIWKRLGGASLAVCVVAGIAMWSIPSRPAKTPAVVVLAPEPIAPPVDKASARLFLTDYLSTLRDERSTRALAQQALFDLDERVREAAIKALDGRPREHYVPILLKGFRYPWAPVARHAAEAVAALRITESVFRLVAMLEEPDPDAPFEEPVGEKSKVMVRELVRINHHRNCLLCHAPSFDRSGTVRAVIPAPENPLPPSFSPVYYSERRGEVIVRADITYLRQDFSLVQQVENPGKWPGQQRFDFFVRTRELTGKEAERARRPVAPALSEYKIAIAWRCAS